MAPAVSLLVCVFVLLLLLRQKLSEVMQQLSAGLQLHQRAPQVMSCTRDVCAPPITAKVEEINPGFLSSRPGEHVSVRWHGGAATAGTSDGD